MSREYFGIDADASLFHALPMVEKVSLSLDSALLGQARQVAGRRGLSALVNDALRIKLQHERLRRLLSEMDSEFGKVPEQKMKRARKIWPSAKSKPRRAA
jgi:hypothetical protein